MKNCARGFTLLELLVVIVLLVMVISITSISIISGQDGAQMKTTARQLLSVLRSSRTRAIAEGVEAGITLSENIQGAQNAAYGNVANLAEGETLVQDVEFDEGGAPEDYSYTIIPLNETVFLPDQLSLSLTMPGGSGISPPRSILFYPDGSSTGGRLLLSSSVGEMALEVSWLTGEATLRNGL